MEPIILTIAGSAKGCPGPGAYAAILQCKGKEKVIDGRDPCTNEAAMKMKAFILGVSALKLYGCDVELHTDSKEILHVLDNAKEYYNAGWRKTLEEEQKRVNDLKGASGGLDYSNLTPAGERRLALRSRTEHSGWS